MKYKLTDETKEYFGITLHRIVCVTAFGNVAVGDVGGFIEKEENLSQYDNAWVYDNAYVGGNAKVCGNADYIVLKNNWSSGRYFTYTLSNDKWKVGCFYGSGEDLVAKAYEDSELSGDCYKAAVEYVEKIVEAKKKAKATEECSCEITQESSHH